MLDSRQASKLINKTQGKSREGDLQFDKIPHRHSKSPRSKTIEINEGEEEVLELEIDEESKQDANESCESIHLPEEPRETLFKSYEGARQPKQVETRQAFEKQRP